MNRLCWPETVPQDGWAGKQRCKGEKLSIHQRIFKLISIIAVLTMSLSALQPVSAQGGDDGGGRRVSSQGGGEGVKRQVNPWIKWPSSC